MLAPAHADLLKATVLEPVHIHGDEGMAVVRRCKPLQLRSANVATRSAERVRHDGHAVLHDTAVL